MILALDLSLTATGWATDAGLGVLSPPGSHGRGLQRLLWIRDQVLRLAGLCDLVVLEGFSYGSKGKAVFDIAGMGWVVRAALFEAGVTMVEVAPASLKKYATGRGNAKKAEVLVEAVRRLGYEGHDDNVADALWLLHMALSHYGLPGAVQVPQNHKVALAGVRWPEITP